MATRKIDGKWYVDFRFNHKRIRKRSPEDSKRGAEAYEAMLKRKLLDGEPLEGKPKEPEVPTLEVFAKEWMKTYVKTNNKPSEQQRKAHILKKHLLPSFGQVRLDKINAKSIEAYKSDKLGQGLSPKTVNNQVSILRKALVCANDWGYIASVPKVKLLKTPPPDFRYLDADEVECLVSDEVLDMWSVMTLLAVRTGMRIGELLALHWKDVDFTASKVCVRYTLSGREITSPKNNQVRRIPMTPQLHQRMREWKQESTGKLVFPSPVTGKVMTRSAASEALERVCKRVGIEKIGWHVLRHTFATQLTAKGVPIRAVQKLLGHSSIKMTERYSHVAEHTLNSAVMLLECERVNFGQYVGSEEKVTVKRLGSRNAFES